MLLEAAIVVTGLFSLGSADAPHPQLSAQVSVDRDAGQVVVTIGPLDVATGMHYHHDGPGEHAGFTWPEDGWIQGYRIDVVDASGLTLPRSMIHHAGVANLSRRQLVSPTALRLFAVGRETSAVTLPSRMGMRMSAGEDLMAYFALINESDERIEDASLRITLAWRPATAEAQSTPALATGRGAHPSHRLRHWDSRFTEIVPIVLNADPNQFGQPQFDVGPGISTVSTDVTLPLGGFLRAAGGHMHDYASEMRLEDAETGEVLVRLEAELDAEGRIQGVEEKRFPFMLRGIRLDAGRRYRIVSVYDNPTGATLPKAGMAYMAGAFILDGLDAWPALEAQDPRYRNDLAGITGEVDSHVAHGAAMEGAGHSH
jgi:hypothetical protein